MTRWCPCENEGEGFTWWCWALFTHRKFDQSRPSLIAPPSILTQHQHELARFILSIEKEAQGATLGDKIEIGAHCRRLGQVTPPRGQRLCRRTQSAQVRCQSPLLYPRKLRGMAPVLLSTFTVLTDSPANKHKQTSHRIAHALCQGACQIALHTHSQGGLQGTRAEEGIGTVSRVEQH